MLRQILFVLAVAALVSLPRLADSRAATDAGQAVLQPRTASCYNSGTPPAYTPEVNASFKEQVHLTCADGRLSVYRFTFASQAPGREAVSSANRFVPKQDQLRFGRSTVSAPWGQVNQFQSPGEGNTRALTWQWYALDNQTYHNATRVKLAEFVRALSLSSSAPEVYVAQWQGQSDIDNDVQRQAVMQVIADVVGLKE